MNEPICTVCRHPERPEIDRELVRGVAVRLVARRYGLKQQSVDRHVRMHLSAILAAEVLAELDGVLEAIRAGRKGVSGGDVVAQAIALQEITFGLLEDARRGSDLNEQRRFVREVRSNLTLLARLLGAFVDRREVTGTVEIRGNEQASKHEEAAKLLERGEAALAALRAAQDAGEDWGDVEDE